MKEPVDHVVRPRLPWRSPDEPAITECGYDASKVPTITREELKRRAKDLGRTRTMLLTCVTCVEASQRHGSWDDDPRLAVQREIEWEGPRYYIGARDKRGHRLRDELLAIAELIAAHPEEFATIQQRRAWNERKEQRKPVARKESKPDGDPFDARREP